MHPKTRYYHAAIAGVLLLVLGCCLVWRGQENVIQWQTPDDIPLVEWVRQGPTRPSWFPISFQALERHGSKNKRVWEIGVRYDDVRRTRFYGHMRIGDKIRRTDFKIKDIVYRPPGEKDDQGKPARSSIVVASETETLELFMGQPKRDAGGGLIHSFVFFPRTPVRGLGSSFWVKPGKILHLRHLDRSEKYKVIGETAEDVRLQRIEEGDPIGEPVRVRPYDEQEHIEWRRQYSPGHP